MDSIKDHENLKNLISQLETHTCTCKFSYLKKKCSKYGSGHNPKFYNLEELTICSKGVLDYMHFMKYSCDELNPNACFSFYGLFVQ